MKTRILTSAMAVLVAATSAFAGGPALPRSYTVQYDGSRSIADVDGVVSTGEWDAHEVQGDFTLLRTANAPSALGEGMSLTFDEDYLYILYTDTYDFHDFAPGPPLPEGINFGLDNINLYINPQYEGRGTPPGSTDPNAPSGTNPGYQIAWNTYEDGATCGGPGNPPCNIARAQDINGFYPGGPVNNGGQNGIGVYSEAHATGIFGNQARWGGLLGDSKISQSVGPAGAVVEVALSWDDINAPGSVAVRGDFDGNGTTNGDDFLIWQGSFPDNSGTATRADGDANGDGNVDGDDFLLWQSEFPIGYTLTDQGLNIEGNRPNNGDEWIFNLSNITSDGANFLPMWSWHSQSSFAYAPHGGLVFAGVPEPGNGSSVPEPTSLILLAVAGLFAIRRSR